MGNAVKFIELTALNTAAITPFYTAINAGGLPHACSAIRVINTSNIDVVVSFDGIHAHEYLFSNSVLYLPFQVTAQPNAWTSLIAAGTEIFVSAAAPGIGSIMVSGYYV